MTVPRATILPSYAGYTSMQDYVRGTLGPEGLQFLAANFRFRADLTSNDILSYLQFNNEDYAANPNQYVGYPTGGLSQIARSAAEAAVKAGAKLMLNNAVLDLSGSKAQGYCVTTRQNIVQANSVIVAIEPASFAKVTGNVASALQAQQSFKDAKPIQVVIIVQRYATRWWETAFDGSIRRAWTTDSCLNFVEAPVHTYGMGTQALRTVYADGQCALYWQNMQQADPTLGLMKNELQRHLSWLFNMSVPMALETVYENWPSAWHFQHPNAARDIYGVEAWAQDPVPGENVSLVGEAWSPLRTWIQGALTSSVKALNTKYGLNLPIYSSSNDTFPDNGQSDPLNSRRL